jgi:hypothetical protein
MGCARWLLLHARGPDASLAPTRRFANGVHCSARSVVRRCSIDGGAIMHGARMNILRVQFFVKVLRVSWATFRALSNMPVVFKHMPCLRRREIHHKREKILFGHHYRVL